jgi:hypothetical protein
VFFLLFHLYCCLPFVWLFERRLIEGMFMKVMEGYKAREGRNDKKLRKARDVNNAKTLLSRSILIVLKRHRAPHLGTPFFRLSPPELSDQKTV